MGIADKFIQAVKEVMASAMGIMRAPMGHQIDRFDFWEDADGNVRYIKAYQGANSLLYTLEFTDAGAAAAATWSLVRS